jgi:CIC family chloride channel protein
VTLSQISSKILGSLNLPGVGRRLVFGVMIGVVSGLGAIAFNLACASVSHWFLGGMAGYYPDQPAGEHDYFEAAETGLRLWALPLVAALGGLLSGLLVYLLAPEAGGHGTDSAIDAYHNKGGRIAGRVPLVKIIASALTIGSGGSGGREGPIAQIGAGFGSFLADRCHLSARDRRVLLASGIGAGVGSIFHAPLAGALFAAEILYSEAEFESDALIPAAMATIVAYAVFSLHSGFDPLFATPDFEFNSLWELLPYTFLALLVTVAAGLFVGLFYTSHGLFQRWRIHPAIKPMVGGLGAGALGLACYFVLTDADAIKGLDVLSFGYGSLQSALLGQASITLLAILALGKMLTTSLSIGSGGSGGVFGPSMVIGGCLGGIVGIIGHDFFPEVVRNPGAFVAVGMAGFFAAVGNVPISTLVMVSEMTGNYHLLLPSLWVSALAFLLGRQWNIYRSQVPTRFDSPAHAHELNVDVLYGMRVKDICEELDLTTLEETTPIDEIVRVFSRTTQHYFPVMDSAGNMAGILSANDVRQVLDDREAGSVIIASDIANPKVVSVTPEDDLEKALQRFVTLDVGVLPVVEPENRKKLITMISRRSLIHAYNHARKGWQESREIKKDGD